MTTDDPLVGCRVVVVEDEGLTQMQLRRLLTRAGLNVVGVAGDGQAGMDVVLRERPDLVLMDIRMPVMDGLTATRHILSQFHVCVVVLTAYAVEEYRQEAEEIGVCGYVLKPVTAQTLVPQLRDAFTRFNPPPHSGAEA